VQSKKPLEWLVEVNYTGQTDFNQAMNRMIARARGDWIVSVQDYIALPENALEYIQTLPPALYTFPVGKLQPDDSIKWDWRAHRQGDIHWQEWEICFGAAPRQWLIDIGGFYEALDRGWGFDNVNVGYRAFLAKYPIRCDPAIKAVAIDHDALNVPSFKDRRDPALHNERLDAFFKGERVTDVEKYLV
jgi:hypothetical protein